MQVKNASNSILCQALAEVNRKRGYSLEWKRWPEVTRGPWLAFTIKSTKGGLPGSRYSPDGKRLAAASWHAHGYLFEEILRLAPDAVIKSGDVKITKDGGNWNPAPGGPFWAGRDGTAADLSILGDKEDPRWQVPPDQRDPELWRLRPAHRAPASVEPRPRFGSESI